MIGGDQLPGLMYVLSLENYMLSRDEVLKIARLARLTLTEQEIGFYQTQLGRVLEYIRDLNSLETSKTSFVKHVPEDAKVVRPDRAEGFGSIDPMLKNAPSLEAHCFLLPTIVEHS